jgi:arylsulfatase A-like enzyme
MPTDQPNILLIMTDQHRADSLGCYGNSICKTPNIDSLAVQGMRFDSAITCTAICTAARASLVTGLMPHKHGLVANYERNIAYPTELADDIVPFSRNLQAQNYRCGHVGKWHVGQTRGPDESGFEGHHYFGWCPPVQHWDYQQYLKDYDLPPFTFHDEIRGTFPNGQPGNLIGATLDGPVETTWPHYLANRTIERLDLYTKEQQHTAQPFFLNCCIYEPHLPYILPEEYRNAINPRDIPEVPTMRDTFEGKPRVQQHYADHWCFDSFSWEQWQEIIAMYYGSVMAVDDQVGRILVALEEFGLADNTVVLFTADHGAFVGSHKMSDKGPAMYDDIYRIPLLARGPGIVQPNTVCNAPVNMVDLTATFVDLAGGDVPAHYDGRSIAPLLKGETPEDWPDYAIAEFHGHHFPYPQRMIRTADYKLIINPPDVNELYDLKNDPLEMTNLYNNPVHRDAQLQLTQTLYKRLKNDGDNFFHWMTSMCDTGGIAGDASLSQY